jgi:hypothetical protein
MVNPRFAVYDAGKRADLPVPLDNSTLVNTPPPVLPRLRQAVLAATELDRVVTELRSAISLGEPFADPGVGMFGLRNAVFALDDTFLEVVSPIREGTSAGRLLARRGADCGYMVMFQVADLTAARERAAALGIREVFEVSLDDIGEVHLHPADMGGAIVSLSSPSPPAAWRWGGPGWEERSVHGAVSSVTVAVDDPDGVAERWRAVVGGLPGARFVPGSDGPVEIRLTREGEARFGSVRIGGAVTE